MAKISSELPSAEQLSKRGVVSEDVDIGGLVKRHRVVDQTVFDAMFLLEMIDQSHHEAAHLFMDSLVRSGAILSGSGIDPGVHAPAYAVGGAMSDRRMAFSSPYRRVVRDCGEDCARRFMDIFPTIYSYTSERNWLIGIAKDLLPQLNSLVTFYGIELRRDPRRVVRRQVGSRK